MTLIAAGCSPGPGPSSPDGADRAAAVRTADGVEYRGETAVLESFPVQLHTTVTVTNTRTAPVTLTLPDGCTVLLRAYRSADEATPVFDQATIVMCAMAIQEVRLGAGESRRFETRSDAGEILAAGLPDGTYHLRAVMRPNGTTLEVPAGSVQLAIPR